VPNYIFCKILFKVFEKEISYPAFGGKVVYRMRFFVSLLIVAACCCSPHADGEVVGSHAQKSSSLSFEEAFLVSSGMNDAYEQAVGYLYATVDREDLEKSISNCRELVTANAAANSDNVMEFLEILEAISLEDVNSFQSQQLETKEESLSSLHKKVAQELGKYIDGS
jgi:hypothetical protein